MQRNLLKGLEFNAQSILETRNCKQIFTTSCSALSVFESTNSRQLKDLPLPTKLVGKHRNEGQPPGLYINSFVWGQNSKQESINPQRGIWTFVGQSNTVLEKEEHTYMPWTWTLKSNTLKGTVRRRTVSLGGLCFVGKMKLLLQFQGSGFHVYTIEPVLMRVCFCFCRCRLTVDNMKMQHGKAWGLAKGQILASGFSGFSLDPLVWILFVH